MPAKKRTRGRRTHAELFLDKLAYLAPDGKKLISNKTLREELKWEEDRYKRIRNQLTYQKKIVIGRGYGGSVGLASPAGAKGLSVFLSYSHADESFKVDLLKHLSPLKRLGLIDDWHDGKIKPGDEWDKAISSKLEEADIILLLVSIDFINSSYCYDIELEQALDRHQANAARVVPVILRNCMWQQTSFAKLHALPKDARAVSLWPDRDEALLNVADGIRQVAEDLLAST